MKTIILKTLRQHWNFTENVTKLPFVENPDNLPDNYILATKRTANLFSKLRKNLEQLREYDSIINDYLKDGIL